MQWFSNQVLWNSWGSTELHQGLLRWDRGGGGKGSVSSSPPSPLPPGQLCFYLSCLLRFHLQTFEEKLLQTTILRFDLQPASTGSLLAFHVRMALAFQYKVACTGTWVADPSPSICLHKHTYSFDGFVAHPPRKLLWPGYDLVLP